jgi:hypothetical protein
MVVGGKYSFSNPPSDRMNAVSEGFNFLITHFKDPLFPRTISTKITDGRQILVFSREEALSRFKESNFLDCRINAYPDYTEFSGINRQEPHFIFIDLDKSSLTLEAHDRALSITLKNIEEKLAGGKPTVVWSGNGYHIYQPVKAIYIRTGRGFQQV